MDPKSETLGTRRFSATVLTQVSWMPLNRKRLIRVCLDLCRQNRLVLVERLRSPLLDFVTDPFTPTGVIGSTPHRGGNTAMLLPSGNSRRRAVSNGVDGAADGGS